MVSQNHLKETCSLDVTSWAPLILSRLVPGFFWRAPAHQALPFFVVSWFVFGFFFAFLCSIKNGPFHLERKSFGESTKRVFCFLVLYVWLLMFFVCCFCCGCWWCSIVSVVGDCCCYLISFVVVVCSVSFWFLVVNSIVLKAFVFCLFSFKRHVFRKVNSCCCYSSCFTFVVCGCCYHGCCCCFACWCCCCLMDLFVLVVFCSNVLECLFEGFSVELQHQS